MDISAKLKQIRKDQGYSQAEAARLVRVSQRSWARYEAGDRSPPKGLLELFCIKTGLDYDKEFANSE